MTTALILIPASLLLQIVAKGGAKTLFDSWSDRELWVGLKKSAIYVAATVPAQVVLGVWLAIMIDRARRFKRTLLLVLAMPYAIPSVVAALAWTIVFRDRGFGAGFADSFLGIDPTYWYREGAWVSMIVLSVWQFYPFVMLVLLAALSSIPKELELAAVLDGASEWQRLFRIRLTYVYLAIVFAALVRTSFMWTKFDTPWLVGGSTALGDMQVGTVLVYNKSLLSIADEQIASAAGGAILMALLLAVPVVLVFRVHKALSIR